MTEIRSVSPPGRFDPLPADHPGIGEPCAGCRQPLAAGDRVSLCNPTVTDPDEKAKASAGRPHNAEVVLAHEHCVTLWEVNG